MPPPQIDLQFNVILIKISSDFFVEIKNIQQFIFKFKRPILAKNTWKKKNKVSELPLTPLLKINNSEPNSVLSECRQKNRPM